MAYQFICTNTTGIGYTTVYSVMHSIIKDMAAGGKFTIVYPTSFDLTTAPTAAYKVVLQATTAVDPLADTQPWRICFDVSGSQVCKAFVATPLQIKDDGTVLPLKDSSGTTIYEGCGQVGKGIAAIIPAPDAPGASYGFINRANRIKTDDQGRSNPLSYRVTITDHGVAIGVWEGNWVTMVLDKNADNYFNWLLIQRPVNRTTGEVLITGKSPLWCVNGVNGNYWHFIVREGDIPHPTIALDAAKHSVDSFKILNKECQISITEDKKYVISFMNNLNTPRFRYTEELDLIGIVSADVIMDSTNAVVSVYGADRTYHALPANQSYNSGMRVLFLRAYQAIVGND